MRIGRKRNRAASAAASIHDQDRILTGQPDKNNEPDLGEDIVVLSAKVNSSHSRQ
jgi:hypothetical protein